MITFNNFVTKHCYRPFRFLVHVFCVQCKSKRLHFANSLDSLQFIHRHTHTFHSSTRPFLSYVHVKTSRFNSFSFSILFRLFACFIFVLFSRSRFVNFHTTMYLYLVYTFYIVIVIPDTIYFVCAYCKWIVAVVFIAVLSYSSPSTNKQKQYLIIFSFVGIHF